MIAMIDYEAGNTCSVMNALNRLGVSYQLTADHDTILSADKVIFPGVGHAGAAMKALKEKELVDLIKNLTQPVLGICVGMQLFCASSEEGESLCLDLIPLTVKRIPSVNGIKVPHMGWNRMKFKVEEHPLFTNISPEEYLYFVHSYFVPMSQYGIASCDYGIEFCAALQYKNYYGIQFHAEKSGKVGERLIKNFIDFCA